MRKNHLLASLLLAAPLAAFGQQAPTLNHLPDFQTSPFAACKEKAFISQSDVNKDKEFWDVAIGQCGADVQILPDSGFFSQIKNRLDGDSGVKRSIDFMQQVANRTLGHIDHNILLAERLQACVKDAAKDPAGKAWFDEKREVAPANQKEFFNIAKCEDHIEKAKETIAEVGPKVRASFAAVKEFETPFGSYIKGVQKITGNNLEIENQPISASEKAAAKKTVAKLNEKVDGELKEEIEKYTDLAEEHQKVALKLQKDAEKALQNYRAGKDNEGMVKYENLQREIAEKADISRNPDMPEWFKKYYVESAQGKNPENTGAQSHLEITKFGKAMEASSALKEEISKNLQIAPIVGYLKSDKPGDDEFIAAMQQVIDNAKKSKSEVLNLLKTEKMAGGKGGATKWKLSETQFANQLMDVMKYGAVVNEVLGEDPLACQDATMIANSILTSKNRRDAAFIVGMVGAGVAGGFIGPAVMGSVAVGGTIASAMASTIGAGVVAGSMYADDYRIAAAAERRAFSNVDSKTAGRTVAEVKDFQEAREAFIYDLAFSPLDFVGSGLGGMAVNAGKKTFMRTVLKPKQIEKLKVAMKAKGQTEVQISKLLNDLKSADQNVAKVAAHKVMKLVDADPEKVKFLQLAASKGVFVERNRATVEAVTKLIDDPEVFKVANKVMSELSAAKINAGNQDQALLAAINGAQFGVTDPANLARIINDWDEGLEGLAKTYEIAAKKLKDPKISAIKSVEARQAAAFDSALEDLRKANPRLKQMPEDQWAAWKTNAKACPLSRK